MTEPSILALIALSTAAVGILGTVIKHFIEEKRFRGATEARTALQDEVRRLETLIRTVEEQGRARLEDERRQSEVTHLRLEERAHTLIVDVEKRIDVRIKDLSQPLNVAVGKVGVIDERTSHLITDIARIERNGETMTAQLAELLRIVMRREGT